MDAQCVTPADGMVRWSICIVGLSSIAILGALINGGVICIFLRSNLLKQVSNKILLNLLIGQFILAVVMCPMRIAQIVRSENSRSCHLQSLIGYANALIMISTAANCCIAYDRYLFVSRRMSYEDIIRGQSLYLILLIPWCSCLFYLFPRVFGDIVYFSVTMVIIIVAYASLFINYGKVIQKLNKKVDDEGIPKATRVARKLQNRKVIASCVWIVTVEILFSFPGVLCVVCGAIHLATDQSWLFWSEWNAFCKEIAFMSYLASCCINPMLYLKKNHEFKRKVKKMFNNFRNTVQPLAGETNVSENENSHCFRQMQMVLPESSHNGEAGGQANGGRASITKIPTAINPRPAVVRRFETTHASVDKIHHFAYNAEKMFEQRNQAIPENRVSSGKNRVSTGKLQTSIPTSSRLSPDDNNGYIPSGGTQTTPIVHMEITNLETLDVYEKEITIVNKTIQQSAFERYEEISVQRNRKDSEDVSCSFY